MSKRGENIRKRKDGRWEARIKIKINGENKYHSIYAYSYREAKEKKNMYLKKYSLSRPLSETPANKVTMEQCKRIVSGRSPNKTGILARDARHASILL